jgi:hypothetical protein
MFRTLFDTLVLSTPNPKNIHDIALLLYGLHAVLTNEPYIRSNCTICDILEAIEECDQFQDPWYIRRFCRKLRNLPCSTFAECQQSIQSIITKRDYQRVIELIRIAAESEDLVPVVVVTQPDLSIMLGNPDS